MTYLFEMRLTGENLSAENVRSRDIGELIASVEEMLANIIAHNYPDLGLEHSDISIGLTDIQQGSYILRFGSRYEEQLAAAVAEATNAITNESYERLPMASIVSLKAIRKITRKYETDVELWERNGDYHRLATVTTMTRIAEPDIHAVEGKTTLYGMVTGIGGFDPPRVRMRLTDGSIRRFNVARGDNWRVAKKLGQRLYTEVGIKGTAKWTMPDYFLVDFLVEEVTDYVGKPMNEALFELSSSIGQYWSEIDDVEQFIRDIRGDGDDVDEFVPDSYGMDKDG